MLVAKYRCARPKPATRSSRECAKKSSRASSTYSKSEQVLSIARQRLIARLSASSAACDYTLGTWLLVCSNEGQIIRWVHGCLCVTTRDRSTGRSG